MCASPGCCLSCIAAALAVVSGVSDDAAAAAAGADPWSASAGPGLHVEEVAGVVAAVVARCLESMLLTESGLRERADMSPPVSAVAAAAGADPEESWR